MKQLLHKQLWHKCSEKYDLFYVLYCALLHNFISLYLLKICYVLCDQDMAQLDTLYLYLFMLDWR